MTQPSATVPHWKVQQRIREGRAHQARIGRVAAFGTLVATSPVLSRIQREVNARLDARRKANP